MQNQLPTIGRVVFALPFIVFGAMHFVAGSAMAGYVPVPGGVFWVYFTGAAMIAGGLGLITKILGKWAGLGLAALMLIFVVFVHLPNLSNPQMQQLSMTMLLKDLVMFGGALTLAGILAREEKPGRVAQAAQAAG